MKIPQKLMTACVKDFKEYGTLTWPLIIRRHKVSLEMAQAITETISKRYPNLWNNREENRNRKFIENMKP